MSARLDPISRLNRLAPLAAALMLLAMLRLGGIDADAIDGADPYFDASREAIEAVPYRIGPWVGVDVDVPPSAVRLLQPNKLMQRQFVNPSTGMNATLLVVHCRDTRDMQGHYPPNCYPSAGWLGTSSAETTIRVDGVPYAARRYEYTRTTAQGLHHAMVVVNFFVLPAIGSDSPSAIVPDIDAVDRASQRRTAAGMGAAQFQVITDADMPEADRAAVVEEFVRALGPTIREIARGVSDE